MMRTKKRIVWNALPCVRDTAFLPPGHVRGSLTHQSRLDSRCKRLAIVTISRPETRVCLSRPSSAGDPVMMARINSRRSMLLGGRRAWGGCSQGGRLRRLVDLTSLLLPGGASFSQSVSLSVFRLGVSARLLLLRCLLYWRRGGSVVRSAQRAENVAGRVQLCRPDSAAAAVQRQINGPVPASPTPEPL